MINLTHSHPAFFLKSTSRGRLMSNLGKAFWDTKTKLEPPKITYLLLLSEADEVVGDSTGHEL